MTDPVNLNSSVSSSQNQTTSDVPQSVVAKLKKDSYINYLISNVENAAYKGDFKSLLNYGFRINQDNLIPLLTFTGTDKYSELEQRLIQRLHEELQNWKLMQSQAAKTHAANQSPGASSNAAEAA